MLGWKGNFHNYLFLKEEFFANLVEYLCHHIIFRRLTEFQRHTQAKATGSAVNIIGSSLKR